MCRQRTSSDLLEVTDDEGTLRPLSNAVCSAPAVSLCPQTAVAQEFTYPVCNISDSAMTVSEGLWSISHAFGADTVTYSNEFDLQTAFPAFSAVFDLYL